jgi:hypothetical protein
LPVEFINGEMVMITLKECIDFADIGEDEVRSIAKRKGVPEIIAVAWCASAMTDEDEESPSFVAWQSRPPRTHQGGDR